VRDHREHVARVGDQDEDGVRRLLEQLGHELAHDPGVHSGQVEPGLARLLPRARGDDDH
jgi:hypothetical protein